MCLEARTHKWSVPHRRDRFLAAFSNLPEVLSAMADKQALFRRRRVRVPKVVVVGPDESVSPRS